MLTADEATLAHAEKLAGGEAEGLMKALRTLPLEAFAKLLLGMPDARWPGLSARLPSMPPEAIQKSWTGRSGEVVMRPARVDEASPDWTTTQGVVRWISLMMASVSSTSRPLE